MNNLKIHFLNTIWSDSIILEKNNHFSFVDTGSSFYYPMVKDHLNKLNVNAIDFIFLTHFHSDHYGNIVNILTDYKVNTLYLKHYYGLDGTTSSGFESNEEYIENEFKNYNSILEVAKEKNTKIVYIDEIALDEFKISFEETILDIYDYNNRLYEMYLNPNSQYYMQKRFNENFNCSGIFIKEKEHSIFLGGDVTCSSTDIEELASLSIKMINKIYNKHNIDHIDLYKSCHHGGGGTNTLDLCKLLNPNYVIITNTAKWLDNWSTYDNLKEANKNVIILPTDYQKYIFDIGNKITYKKIEDTSLFLLLNKK